MHRRELLKYGAAAITLLVTAAPVLGAGLADQFSAELKAAGYKDIRVSRTLLGRMRVIGMRGGFKREIVFDPRTGEILRDLTVKVGSGFGWGSDSSSSSGSSGSSGSGSSGSSDDDDKDDDDPDDNSGSGSNDDDDDDDSSDDSSGGSDDDD
ncbi:PepSY domain-containing protein [Sinirhodobacter sp. WL0062]|uniref:PepSY domain-containing protein n=1 Tax=Rhodobacter flavimaris TaxID=2907145 RepID=A0ABS8YWQ3_9RHOB|nr:PepSY domain-containing protein [Sinirhodobacter sp. WL0062]MCE5974236.1 PepSY domain-containing protein [Sinirhodobacter sp. WL0062]